MPIQSQPTADFVASLMTVRRIFEPAAAALAARVASEEQLKGIAEAYAGMEAARNPEELLEPDLAFHRRIAEATGNDLLAYIGNMLSLALRESIQLTSKLPNTHALSLPRHKAILTAILHRDALAARLSPEAIDATLREVGHRAAEGAAAPPGDLAERVRHGLAVLEELGGLATCEQRNGGYVIQGASCPLAEALPGHPEVCHLAETLLSDVIGAPVVEHCERGESPRCCFEVLARDGSA